MTAVLSCRFPLGRNPDISPMSHLREPLRVRNPVSKPYKPCRRELAHSSVMTAHQQTVHRSHICTPSMAVDCCRIDVARVPPVQVLPVPLVVYLASEACGLAVKAMMRHQVRLPAMSGAATYCRCWNCLSQCHNRFSSVMPKTVAGRAALQDSEPVAEAFFRRLCAGLQALSVERLHVLGQGGKRRRQRRYARKAPAAGNHPPRPGRQMRQWRQGGGAVLLHL